MNIHQVPDKILATSLLGGKGDPWEVEVTRNFHSTCFTRAPKMNQTIWRGPIAFGGGSGRTLISILEMRRNMRRAMEMEARPMLSQTGGEKGAHHCLD